MTIVPLTDALAQVFYGKAPPKSIRGVVALKDGEPWGIAGVYLSKSRWMMFFEVKNRPKEFSFEERRTIIRGYRAVMKIIEESTMPIQALADESIEGSDRLLEHIGFAPLVNRIYEWPSYQ